jgi:hypothetical protein
MLGIHSYMMLYELYDYIKWFIYWYLPTIVPWHLTGNGIIMGFTSWTHGFSGASFLNAHLGYHFPELAVYNRPKNHGVLKGFSRFKHQKWGRKTMDGKAIFSMGSQLEQWSWEYFFLFFSTKRGGSCEWSYKQSSPSI